MCSGSQENAGCVIWKERRQRDLVEEIGGAGVNKEKEVSEEEGGQWREDT